MRLQQAGPWMIALWLGATSAWAQERNVTGTIVDAKSHEGVPLATITLKGTKQSVTAEVDGSFTFKNLPEGPITLHIFAEDHEPLDVPVPADRNALRITLTPDYQEEIVVVGRATEVARKNLANSVATVSSEEITSAPAQTVDQALAGKIAGANIQSNSGAPGGGMQIQLRGVSTINGSSTPLFVVDGVIVSDVAIASNLSAITASRGGGNSAPDQDNQVNRIADLNPDDIQSVEVLKGASAAAIYGSKASNGVVIITTKRGREGETKVDFDQRVGFSQLANEIGSRKFNTVDEAVATFGEAARAPFLEGKTYDHERELAGRLAPTTATSLSVTGGGAGTHYFASLLSEDDEGIMLNTGYAKQSLRLNLSHDFGDRLEVSTTTNLIHSLARRGLTNNDNRGVTPYIVFASTPSFYNLQKRPDGTYPPNPFLSSMTNPLQTAELMTNNEDVWRLIGSVDATLNILKTDTQELRLLGNIGVDRFQQKNELVFPAELYFEPIVDAGLPGASLFGTSDNLNLNTGINLVHTYRAPSRLLSATTSAGYQYELRQLSLVNIVSRNLVAGQTNVDAGTQVKVSENRQLVLDQGFYLQEEMLMFDERLTLTGAVRGETSSANGDPYKPFFYPKAAAAYRIPKLPSAIQELKVRAAYGETGNQPLYGMKFTPLNATQNIEGLPGIVVNGTVGSPDIRPERQREIEAGVDGIAFDGRAVVELSIYQRDITDLLLQRTLAPSTGFTTQFFNGGELRNRGVEAMVQGTPVKTIDFQWLSRITFALNRSQIVQLPVPAFNTGGFGTSVGVFRIQQGASATQIVGNNGLKPDGTCCIVSKVGDTEPTFRMSFVNNFSWKGFTLTSLLDWQQGSDVINLTQLLYDLGQNSVDYLSAGQKRLQDFNTSTRPYVESATFLKLRELTLSYDLPAAWVNSHLGFIHSVRFSLSARNLLTFTNYPGLDPEVSNFGNQPIARNIDVAPYPPSRSYWASIHLGF